MYYNKCQIQVEICQCDTDAPAWGHCKRKNIFPMGWEVHTGPDEITGHMDKGGGSHTYIENGRGINMYLHDVSFLCKPHEIQDLKKR